MKRISVCCFRENSLVELECVGTSIEGHLDENRDHDFRYPSTCWSIEGCLHKFMKSSVTEGKAPTNHISRPDIAWLRCRTPFVAEKETVLGLLECDDQQPRDIPIEFHAWIASSVSEMNQQSTCGCVPYTNATRRSALHHVSLPPPLTINPSNSVTRTIEHVKNNVNPLVHWVDFRTISNFSLSSASEIAHFLKSLLGSSQHVSPWMSSDDLSKADKQHLTPLSQSDCVIAVFSSPISETLAGFRVSDICPSWSLYSTLSAELPRLNFTGSNQAISFPWNAMKKNLHKRTDFEYCEIYIYRKLPAREYLSSRHPETNVEALKGCLWESLVVYPPVEEEKKLSALPCYECRLVAPPYINPLLEFPYLETLVEQQTLQKIQQEAAMIPQWTAWPEQQHYKVSDNAAGAPWHVFPLCHCFPADDPSNLKWIRMTSAHVPKTVAHLKKIVGSQLRTALFSRLDPESVLEAHAGWSDLANYVYRVHLPLQVPPGGLCGTWVDGCVEIHEVGRLQAFDDSKTHRAFNYSSHDRVVLILDIARPPDLPLGTAKGGHSDELDKFIEQMGGSA